MGKTVYDFSGQTAVVTGASAGIGKAAAEAFAAGKARVFLLDIDEGKGAAAAKAIPAGGGEAAFLRCDVTDPASVEAAFGRILEEAGRIDILLNNAGGFWQQNTTENITDEEWSRVVDLNLKGVYLTSKAAIPAFKRQKSGRIINMGSLAGLTTFHTSSPPYSAAKAGVHALTRVLAFELGGDEITVNAIAPGTTATERVVAVRDEAQRAKIGQGTSLGRIGEVEDIIGCILFLASPESKYVTGETLSVNGGRLMV